eukprot:13831-Pelagococcus_subviridis.AAC.1
MEPLFHRRALERARLVEPVQHLLMRGVVAVREVETRDAHARAQELAHAVQGPALRAHRAHDVRLAVPLVRLQNLIEGDVRRALRDGHVKVPRVHVRRRQRISLRVGRDTLVDRHRVRDGVRLHRAVLRGRHHEDSSVVERDVPRVRDVARGFRGHLERELALDEARELRPARLRAMRDVRVVRHDEDRAQRAVLRE